MTPAATSQTSITLTLMLHRSGPAHQLRETAHIADQADQRLTLCGLNATMDTWRWHAVPNTRPTFGLLMDCCPECALLYRASQSELITTSDETQPD
jgi:hypothetical protein